MERIWQLDITLCSNGESFGLFQYKAIPEFGEKALYTDDECKKALEYLRTQKYNKKEEWYEFRQRQLKYIKENILNG